MNPILEVYISKEEYNKNIHKYVDIARVPHPGKDIVWEAEQDGRGNVTVKFFIKE